MTLRPNWKWCLLAAAFAQLYCLPPTRTESGDGPKVITPTLSPTNVQPENLIVRKTVYVPIYSQIYVGSARMSFQLTATLSVRNTDRGKPIVTQSITYFDSTGSVVREYLEAPSLLGPLATADFIVERADTTGGSGASFLVEWGAATAPRSRPEPPISARDVAQRLLGFALHALRQLIEHVGRLVEPATLLPGCRIDLPQGRPEAHRAVAYRSSAKRARPEFHSLRRGLSLKVAPGQKKIPSRRQKSQPFQPIRDPFENGVRISLETNKFGKASVGRPTVPDRWLLLGGSQKNQPLSIGLERKRVHPIE